VNNAALKIAVETWEAIEEVHDLQPGETADLPEVKVRVRPFTYRLSITVERDTKPVQASPTQEQDSHR